MNLSKINIFCFCLGNEKYGFIVDNEDFTSKKLTTKLLQQIQVGTLGRVCLKSAQSVIGLWSDTPLPLALYELKVCA